MSATRRERIGQGVFRPGHIACAHREECEQASVAFAGDAFGRFVRMLDCIGHRGGALSPPTPPYDWRCSCDAPADDARPAGVSGRISMAPYFELGQRRAQAIASSRSGTSIMK